MTKKPYAGKIPFRSDTGAALDYADAWSVRSSHTVMVDNFTFEDELTFSGWGRGRSAVRIYMKTGRGFDCGMFMTDFAEIVPLLVDGRLRGTWTFCKRGANYGVCFIGK